MRKRKQRKSTQGRLMDQAIRGIIEPVNPPYLLMGSVVAMFGKERGQVSFCDLRVKPHGWLAEYFKQKMHTALNKAILERITTPRQGYRTFICDECQHTWEEATRDAYSPSGETCPKCREGYVQPSACRLDPTLPVDNFGNLIHPETP